MTPLWLSPKRLVYRGSGACPTVFTGGITVPWYWTDDLSRILLSEGLIGDKGASSLASSPVAVRRVEMSIEAAAQGMADDDEIPLAA